MSEAFEKEMQALEDDLAAASDDRYFAKALADAMRERGARFRGSALPGDQVDVGRKDTSE